VCFSINVGGPGWRVARKSLHGTRTPEQKSKVEHGGSLITELRLKAPGPLSRQSRFKASLAGPCHPCVAAVADPEAEGQSASGPGGHVTLPDGVTRVPPVRF
jgi:hypothetical protein